MTGSALLAFVFSKKPHLYRLCRHCSACGLYKVRAAFLCLPALSLREGRIPFDISLNRSGSKKVAAMLEAERPAKDQAVAGYPDLDELFTDLKA